MRVYIKKIDSIIILQRVVRLPTTGGLTSSRTTILGMTL